MLYSAGVGDGSRITVAAPVLAEYGIPWTIFVVGTWADGRHPLTPGQFLGWDELVALAASGATIGSHSMSHPDFGRIRGQQVVDELAAAVLDGVPRDLARREAAGSQGVEQLVGRLDQVRLQAGAARARHAR